MAIYNSKKQKIHFKFTRFFFIFLVNYNLGLTQTSFRQFLFDQNRKKEKTSNA